MKKKKYIFLPALSILLLCTGLLSGCGVRFNDYTGTYEIENLSISFYYRASYNAGGNVWEHIEYNDFKLEELYKEINFFVGKNGVMFKAVPVSQTFTLKARNGYNDNLTVNTPLIESTYKIMQIFNNGQDGILMSVKNDIQYGFDYTVTDPLYFNKQNNSIRLFIFSFNILKESFDFDKGQLNETGANDLYYHGLNFKKTKSYDKLDEWNFFDNTGGKK